MKSGGSKQKGAAFERLVCEKLSRWIDPASDRSFFWRSAMSGGRATVRRYAGKRTDDQAGDICSIAPEGNVFVRRFSVECKHVKDLKLTSGILAGKEVLALFWRQVSRDASHAGKKPLLIARQNMYPVLAFVRTQDVTLFGPISAHERARLFTLGRTLGAASVSMFYLDDLLRSPYVESRFIRD